MSWDTAGAGGDSFAEPANNDFGGGAVDAYGGSYGAEGEGAGGGGGGGFGGDCYNCGETG